MSWQSAALSSAIQPTITPEFAEKLETIGLNTLLPLILQCAGYSVTPKEKEIFWNNSNCITITVIPYDI